MDPKSMMEIPQQVRKVAEQMKQFGAAGTKI
jgi:hypothetical protein